jgi:cysteine-rich repeat protein
MLRLDVLLALALGISGAAACSILNAPDDVVPPGAGGAGGATTSTTSQGGGGSGGLAQGGGGMGGGGAPPIGECGNGALEQGEECDDGNLDLGDACSDDCKPTVFVIAADAMIQNDGPEVGRSGVDGGKGFLVVWREDNAGALSLKAATYGATGQRLGGTLDVSTTGGAARPRMGTNAQGLSLVAWQSSADSGALRFRSVQPDGNPAGMGDALISGSTAAALSDVGTKSGGEFCLVWINVAMSPSAIARCFDPQGASTFTVNQTIGASNGAGTPGIWSSGTQFVAAWNDTAGTLTGRALDAAGAPQGMPFKIPSNGNQNTNAVGLPLGMMGGHVAVFEQVFGSGMSTFTRLTKREFQSLDTSSVLDSFVSSSADHDEEGAAVAGANGRFAVAWADNNVNFGDILTQVFNADGSKLGLTIQVNKLEPGGTQRNVQIAVNDDGDAMLVWETEQMGLRSVSGLIQPRLLPK